MVSGSQFNWGPGEASRLTSAKGPLGPFGKFAFAFTRFRTNVTMKLITEFHDLRSGTPENAGKPAGSWRRI